MKDGLHSFVARAGTLKQAAAYSSARSYKTNGILWFLSGVTSSMEKGFCKFRRKCVDSLDSSQGTLILTAGVLECALLFGLLIFKDWICLRVQRRSAEFILLLRAVIIDPGRRL